LPHLVFKTVRCTTAFLTGRRRSAVGDVVVDRLRANQRRWNILPSDSSVSNISNSERWRVQCGEHL